MTTTAVYEVIVAAECVACGVSVPIVNFRRDEFGPGIHGGYLGRHHRKGTRPGTKCSGSFGPWVGKAS